MRDLKRRISALERASAFPTERQLSRLTREDAIWFLSRAMTPDGEDFNLAQWTKADQAEGARRLAKMFTQKGPPDASNRA
jgi:hypothetical protein